MWLRGLADMNCEDDFWVDFLSNLFWCHVRDVARGEVKEIAQSTIMISSSVLGNARIRSMRNALFQRVKVERRRESRKGGQLTYSSWST